MSQQVDATDKKPAKKSPSFTTLLTAGVVLGLAWGLFFGEYGAWVGWIGDAFVGLLQMTVLPYVAVSLICNIGRLTPGETGRLARVALGVLLLLWFVGLITLLVMRFCFPMWEGGSFFSTSLVTEPKPMNWLELFIPANLFLSLTNNLVPAVVLFSIGFGVALIPVSNKDLLLDNLDVMVDGLSRLNKLVVRLSPIGIFGIVGHASGTISLEQFRLLQGYLLAYGAAALLCSLWILPALIACCTPFSQREVLHESRDVLITAFIIGNTFVVLPMIIDAVERLMQKTRGDSGDVAHSPGYTVQLAYPFPDIGRIVGLVFIPFAAWFYGTEIEVAKVVQLIGTGFVGSFAKLVITIPMLLDLAEIPTDIFNLFLAVGVIAGRFGDLMKAMHLLAFSVLTASYLQGDFRFDPVRIVSRGLTTAGLLVVTVLGIRTYLAYSFQDRFSREDLVVARQLLAAPAEATILEQSEPNPVPMLPGEDRMDRILRRGVIRIGFESEKLPFSYYNRDRELVGFDIDMAHQLARDLGVRIEFVPFLDDVIQPLRSDHFDVAMSGVEGTVERATALPQMESYMEVTRAIVVLDHRRKQFRSLSQMAREALQDEKMRVAYVRGSIQAENIRDDLRGLGLGTAAAAVDAAGLFEYVEGVELNNEREFFESEPPIADLLATSAEEGAAWTLKHPQYAVVRPKGFDARSPLYYFVAEESRFEEFMNSWLKLKKLNGTVPQLYDYWILGRDSQARPPRWCILRNVLGWVGS